jgi:hypothetical protein
MLSLAVDSPGLAQTRKLLDQIEETSSQLRLRVPFSHFKPPTESSLRDLAADARRRIQMQLGSISPSLTVRVTLLARVRELQHSHSNVGTALCALEDHLQRGLGDSEGMVHAGAMQLGVALSSLLKLARAAASQQQPASLSTIPTCPAMSLLLQAHVHCFSEALAFEEGRLVIKARALTSLSRWLMGWGRHWRRLGCLRHCCMGPCNSCVRPRGWTGPPGARPHACVTLGPSVPT